MRVKQAEYIENYKIKVVFSDGVAKVVDFAPFLKNAKHVFLPLKDIDYFKEFNVDDITLSWPNGADFDPELLYEIGMISKSKQMKSPGRRMSPKPSSARKKTPAKKIADKKLKP